MDDKGLPFERTALGWRRTGLAAAGVTGVFLRARIEDLTVVAVLSIALAGAVVLVIVAVIVRHPARRDGRIAGLVAGLVAIIAVAQLAAIAFT
jgi:hypothetical protein